MPELIEQMYSSQQIVIPPKYPYILKRYCKAAIKTQPYDLLRWSFEYFKALAEHRPPPVKLRLEYPVYSTEGGLTRGCLKVLAHQLYGMAEIPTPILKQAWQGFCLDAVELKRILCLCEVYKRQESVPYFHFLAVAGGMLTKCLTHTMILLCESLTKEPDGGSAAIPMEDFLTMYHYLAQIDASKDVQYHDGFREGTGPAPEDVSGEEVTPEASDRGDRDLIDLDNDDDYWEDQEVQRLALINDHVARTARLSVKLNLPIIGKIERSPSIERMREIERDNYMRERVGKPTQSEEIDRVKVLMNMDNFYYGNNPEIAKKISCALKDYDSLKKQPKQLKQLSTTKMGGPGTKTVEPPVEGVTEVEKKEAIDIFVFDEDQNAVEYEIYGEPKDDGLELVAPVEEITDQPLEEGEELPAVIQSGKAIVELFLAEIAQIRRERLKDLEQTFDDIAAIVDKYQTANYDLGMIAGRQMSTTSGEFIVQYIEKEIMAYIDDQIAILPDPDLKKKKAKPEEVAMIRDILEQFLDDNMDIIAPEVEEVEEEETAIPEIVMVYAVPGIGGPVDPDTMADFEDYIKEVCKVQAEMVMPRNIRHFLCPPLEKYIEHDYGTNEQVATGGAITE